MARKKITTLAYRAIRIEGGLIPADELTRLTTLADPASTEQTEAQYRIPKGLKLRDEIGRDFKIALSLWADFLALRKRSDVDAYEVTVRELLLPLMRDVLHFSDVERCAPIERSGHSYAIGHAAEGGRVPLVFAAHDQPLDAPAERFGETNPDTGKVRRRSPYMLAQEALNASDDSLWAIVTNGLTLRILRDNPSLTRPAYVEVDLEALFTEELHPDFTAFWLLAHASRFGGPAGEPTNCAWERWKAAGQEAGVTVRTNLRYQVADALRALGTGFLSHPANGELRAALQHPDSMDGTLSQQAFFEELLRLVYRLIFLSTVEDRIDKANGHRLIFTPNSSPEVQQRYLSGYSMTWLRERAVRRSQYDRHSDLWQALTITFGALAKGEPHLGLPALGGLFDANQCAWLDGAQLENRWLLAAVFQLGWFRADGGLSRVNYRDMGPEELGSVYESLLELVPDLQMLSQPVAARLAFVGDDGTEGSIKGNTRKLTGSYYTPDSLVQELIKTALDPVIADTVRGNSERPVEALLSLTVCDPACGSGHFLLAAARRLADEVAVRRAAVEREGGVPTPADFRHALRDVVSRCIYGVDKNPMAIQLAKTALWLEAYSPDRPLSFVDHHLRVGDALLGVLDPKVLEQGIPDEAYNALSGDDKAVATALKKQNKADLKSWRGIASGDLLTQAGLAVRAVSVETLDDDTPEHLAAKRQAWAAADTAAQASTFARLANTYVAAFLASKLADAGDTVPLSGYLWTLLSGQPAKAEVENAVEDLCRQHGVFHWWVAFPQVAAQGGFSVMLGNPPWEQLQLSEEEFFAPRAPSVAALAGDTRKKAIAELEKSAPWLWDQFLAARRQYDATNIYFRTSGRFPLTAYGKLNTYALFSETFLQATGTAGRAGFIVPTGIATDESTSKFFDAISSGRLVRLHDMRTGPGLFSEIGHQRYKFCLLTIGTASSAEFAFFALRVEDLADTRRHFQLTPSEFALINPNTRTCPVFRSQRDAELTKKLYRAAPVLIEEAAIDETGNVVRPEINPWDISFSQGLFNMTSDSALFANSPAAAAEPLRLPLYEAKMMHQFDHRWATYVDAPDKPSGLDTADVSLAQKADADYSVRPRYWVPEREVLASIARVPTRVTKAWLALHASGSDVASAQTDEALADLLAGLAAWVAGELFIQTAGTPATGGHWTHQQVLSHIAPTESALRTRFPHLYEVLQSTGLTTKRAVIEFPKWAVQNGDARLDDDELFRLAEALRVPRLATALLELLDEWLVRRSPQWLMGWRDICRSTDERTVIASVVPRVGIGHTMPLFFTHVRPPLAAALLGNWLSLTFDYVARQKVGGTHLTYGYLKQLPVLPPERYTTENLTFIVSRILELTYTAHDLEPWANDLAAYDPRPAAERGQPFAWNPERRAQLRAELDAYYARLYGLTRDELRYVLDPADVMGPDYPSETFRVLKSNEMREFGEYRTQRLVLEAWDRQSAMPQQNTSVAPVVPAQYSAQGLIRNAEEAKFAGLIVALVEHRPDGCTVAELQSLVARSVAAARHLDPEDERLLMSLISTHVASNAEQLVERVRPIVQRLEAAAVLMRQALGAVSSFKRGAGPLPGDVSQVAEHADIARLLLTAESRRLAAERASTEGTSTTPKSTGTR